MREPPPPAALFFLSAHHIHEIRMKTLLPAVLAALALTACQSAQDTEQASAVWGGDYEKAAVKTDPETGEQYALNPAAEPPRPSTGFSGCDKMHPGGAAPQIVAPEFAEVIEPTYTVLCYRAFAIGHSGRTRTALWSAELLDKTSLRLASDVARVDRFAADDNLPEDQRSELSDYRGSGWERGHLAPSADMPSASAQEESFRLSNIVPQNGSMNGGPWRELEMRVRQEAQKRRVFLVTGPIFRGATQALDRRVLIPTALFKAMYSVNKGATVFIMENNEKAKTYTLSVDQFTKTFGLDPFPALPEIVRKHDIARGPIPKPKIQTAEPQPDLETEGKERKKPRPCGQWAAKRGTDLNLSIEQFRTAYGREPYPDEFTLCDKA